MAFEDFTYADLFGKLGLTVRHRSLFADTPSQSPSAWLLETLGRSAKLAPGGARYGIGFR